MDKNLVGDITPRPKWRKVAYGGMQIGYDDNYTDDSFLEEMVMSDNVVRRYLLKRYIINISFLITRLYILAPIYLTLTRSTSSDSIWAITVFLLLLHLFMHDYSGSTIRVPGALNTQNLTICISLNASIVVSMFVASRLPSRLHVFAVMLFSFHVFLFAPLVTYCIKKFSFKLHLLFSFALMGLTLYSVYALHRLFFFLFLVIVVLVNVVCPYWLNRMQEYKFEINGLWDEAKLCFDITD